MNGATFAPAAASCLAPADSSTNAKLRSKGFQTSTSPNWSGSQRNNTGDAIQAAERAGAALDLMDAAWVGASLPSRR